MDVKEAIERIKRKITIGECEKNIGIPVYIADLKVVLSELEKKEKIVDLMADTLSSLSTRVEVIIEQFEKEFCEFINSDEDCCWKIDKQCKDCIKEYFTKKCEEE